MLVNCWRVNVGRVSFLSPIDKTSLLGCFFQEEYFLKTVAAGLEQQQDYGGRWLTPFGKSFQLIQLVQNMQMFIF